jgi:hypothetical protein
MTGKDKRIIVRATQDDPDRFNTLAEKVAATESSALWAIVRTATVQQVLNGIKLGQRRGM